MIIKMLRNTEHASSILKIDTDKGTFERTTNRKGREKWSTGVVPNVKDFVGRNERNGYVRAIK